MGDPQQDPEPPYQQSARPRGSQVSDQGRSREQSLSQAPVPQEMQQLPLDAQLLSGMTEMPESQATLQGWAQGAGLSQYDSSAGSQGGAQYLSMSAGFPSDFQRQTYLDEGRAQATHNADLMLQQLQGGQGNLLRQLESSYQDPRPDYLGQFNAYQREDAQFGQGTQHGPYMRHDPALQFSSSELSFMPFDMEVSEPEPRELAVQNAKAYLQQTSVSCDLSL